MVFPLGCQLAGFERRRSPRTFTIRLAASDAAERRASEAAAATTSALKRIGVDKVMALFLLVWLPQRAKPQSTSPDIVAAPSTFSEMTKM
jgi:hypothetical protein